MFRRDHHAERDGNLDAPAGALRLYKIGGRRLMLRSDHHTERDGYLGSPVVPSGLEWGRAAFFLPTWCP